jgi:MoxR-like ATPase
MTDATTPRLPLEEVFKIGGVPTHTFVQPAEYARLKVALRTPGRGLIVEGPSGIGKSTAVSRALDELGVDAGVQPLSARNPGDVGYIELLPTTEDFGTVVIDDFHVLNNDTRREIAARATR